MKKILAITGIRSDYDLMSSLYKLLNKDSEINFGLIVGGAHMSQTFGRSFDLIKADGIKILLSVESLIDGNTKAARLKTASIMLQSIIDIVANWAPDIIIYAGDREEVWIGAMLGTYLEVPTVHFYGGDHTNSGHVDNPVRHAVSKLSTAHFVATQEHKDRLMGMGEDSSRIFITGSLALDNFVNHTLISVDVLFEKLNIVLSNSKYGIVLFHPDPEEKEQAAEYVSNIVDAMLKANLFIFIGYPNSDPFSKNIIDVIESYRGDSRIYIYKNLPRDDFISLYKNAQLIIGNSSSGIMESASIPIPAINVGLRQRGRLAAANVVFCDGMRSSIENSISYVMTQEFRDNLKLLENPYGDGQSTNKALGYLKSVDFQSMRLKIEDPLNIKIN